MKQNVRLVAFLLAMVMLFAFSGCEAAIPSTSGSNPTTNSVPTTNPSDKEYSQEQVDELITALAAATTEASANYDASLEVLTNDFTAKAEGTQSPVFEEMTQAMAAARDERVAELTAMADALNHLDLKDVAAVTSKVAEAEALLSLGHTYGEKIRHSRNAEGIACTEAEYYQICTLCNALTWSTGAHQWYYSRSLSTHQKCCLQCDATEEALAHNSNAQGKCEDCNYTVNANILIIESIDGESNSLTGMIDTAHTLTIVNVKDSDKMPSSIDDLKVYDEVILVNIANADMPQGFAEMLQSFVQDFGGGLLTIGGNTADSTEDDWQPHAYDNNDMKNSLYQEMLPVEITDYTPPMAVMILVDVSGSMWYPGSEEPYETSKLFAAMQGAEACLDALSDRDYVGVMALADEYYEACELTPCTQRDKILQAIAELKGPGGTIYSPALERAGQALNAMTGVEKKHIIMITDGEPSADDIERYLYMMQENAKAGITMSIVGLKCVPVAAQNMQHGLIHYAGMEAKNFHNITDLQDVSKAIREDLIAVKERQTVDIGHMNIQPSLLEALAASLGIQVDDLPSIKGFYSSTLKEGATEVLSLPYCPLYAQWDYGNGVVGSFMCDLNGTWSEEFIQSETARELLNYLLSYLANSPENPEDSPEDTI